MSAKCFFYVDAQRLAAGYHSRHRGIRGRNTAVFKLMRYTTEERKLESKPVLLLTRRLSRLLNSAVVVVLR
jgi:hypothetical protein